MPTSILHEPPSWQFVSVAFGRPGATHGVEAVQKWTFEMGAAADGAYTGMAWRPPALGVGLALPVELDGCGLVATELVLPVPSLPAR